MTRCLKVNAEQQIEQLLLRIEKGEPLAQICADKTMPSRRGVYNWIDEDQDFARRFRSARAKGVHYLVEDCLRIADEPVEKGDAVAIAHKRIRIDTRLRLAGKWLPKEYGDKIDINHTAEVTHRHDLSSLSADDLDALEHLIAKTAEPEGDSGRALPAPASSVH